MAILRQNRLSKKLRQRRTLYNRNHEFNKDLLITIINIYASNIRSPKYIK